MSKTVLFQIIQFSVSTNVNEILFQIIQFSKSTRFKYKKEFYFKQFTLA